MPKTCEIENCLCCFHVTKKTPEEKSIRPRGRPAAPKIDDNHKTCRLCGEIKELSEMRAKRNECIPCYNESQRNYYKKNETYQKYKKSKSIEQKKKIKESKELNNSPHNIEETPQNNNILTEELNYIV